MNSNKIVVYIGLTNKYGAKPYLSNDIERDIWILVLNPKKDYRNIKKIMKAVKKGIELEKGKVTITYDIKNYKNEI